MLIPTNTKPSKRTVPPQQQQNLFHKLQHCNTLAKLTQIHTQILTSGFSHKNFLLSKLIYLYVSYGCVQQALAASAALEKPSTTVWNQIIRAHGRSEAPWRSVESFKKMAEAEAEPDGFTYSYLLSACARSGSLLREAEQVHARVLADGYCSSVFVGTSLVNFYSSASEGGWGVERARRVFDEMPERNLVSWNTLLKAYAARGDADAARRVLVEMPERNVVSWTTVLSGCAQSGRWREALSLFHYMRRTEMGFDQVALVAALSACAELGDLRLGRWIHGYVEGDSSVAMQRRLVSLDNALVHMYASCGVIDEAYRVFENMVERSTVSWTTIITGLAKQGRGDEALRMFRRMLHVSEARPDEITFIAALCACSHSGFVDEGRKLFELMTQTLGISPRVKHYGCMVDLLSRAGFLDEAQSIIKTMPMRPGHAVWGALLNGCRIHKDAELVSRVAQKLVVQLDPDQAAGYLVLLSNVYAAARRWVDVALIRRTMVRMGVRKPPGRSWIQINGVVHGFVAGDVSHSQAFSIRKMLVNLTRQSQSQRYGNKLDASDVVLCVEGHSV